MHVCACVWLYMNFGYIPYRLESISGKLKLAVTVHMKCFAYLSIYSHVVCATMHACRLTSLSQTQESTANQLDVS